MKTKQEEKTHTTFSEMSIGDKIKHPVWGKLKLTEKVGYRFYFQSKEWGKVDLVDFGTKFRIL